jgi:hypothetical protein
MARQNTEEKSDFSIQRLTAIDRQTISPSPLLVPAARIGLNSDKLFANIGPSQCLKHPKVKSPKFSALGLPYITSIRIDKHGMPSTQKLSASCARAPDTGLAYVAFLLMSDKKWCTFHTDLPAHAQLSVIIATKQTLATRGYLGPATKTIDMLDWCSADDDPEHIKYFFDLDICLSSSPPNVDLRYCATTAAWQQNGLLKGSCLTILKGLYQQLGNFTLTTKAAHIGTYRLFYPSPHYRYTPRYDSDGDLRETINLQRNAKKFFSDHGEKIENETKQAKQSVRHRKWSPKITHTASRQAATKSRMLNPPLPPIPGPHVIPCAIL